MGDLNSDMIKIVMEPIESDRVLQSVQSDAAGAAVLFLGTTRQFTAGRETVRLEYECYHEMALSELQRLREVAMQQWQLQACSLVHRIGVVPVGEASVAIAVSTAHRADSFAAANWLIDELKKKVPIWKKENFADGTCEWVHPGMSAGS